MVLDVAVQVGLLALSVAGLWLGANLFVDAAIRLARRVGLSELVVGLTVVAFGTSMPEFVVALDASTSGLGEIAVGSVVGSNVYNLALVLGTVGLVRALPVSRKMVYRDGSALLAATGLGTAFLWDLHLSRLEGGVMFALLVAYIAYLVRRGEQPAFRAGAPAGSADVETEHDAEGDDVPAVEFSWRDAAKLVVGLAVVLVSGDLLVGSASALARIASISEWVIGTTVVAAGTSTPELAVSVVALRRASTGVSVGNVVGSNVMNMLGVVGLTGLINPVALTGGVHTSLAWLVAVTVLMVVALRSDRLLSRVEGGLFVASEAVRWVLGLLGILT